MKHAVQSISTPVLLILYNRPQFAQKQLSYLVDDLGCRELLVSIDGPKKTRIDQEKVKQVKQIVARFSKKSGLKLTVKISPKNLGCRAGVSSAITWFFSKVPAGIILEDDCVPDSSFFPYCEALLALYKDDERVGMICGTNPLISTSVESSYFFSHQSIVWGWATWRRAWQNYAKADRLLPGLLEDQRVVGFLLRYTTLQHIKTLRKVVEGSIDTWDYIWYATTILYHHLTVIPQHNLVSNVGFAVDATHTKIKTSQAHLPVRSMPQPLVHPKSFATNPSFERAYLGQVLPWNVVRSIIEGYLKN